MTLAEIEKALADGRVFAHMYGGKKWQARRNGATKTWKTRPGEFRIPVKAGLRACGAITHDNLHHFTFQPNIHTGEV